MGRNPKESPWYSTPEEMRASKRVFVRLGDEARAKLDRLVKARGGVRSKVVEDLIMKEKEP